MGATRTRIAVITTESFFSYSILKNVMEDEALECAAVVVLPSTGSGSPIRTLRRVFKRSGPRLVAYKAATSLAVSARSQYSRFRRSIEAGTPTKLAESAGVPVRFDSDCNHPALVEHLRNLDIDVLVSVNVYQRMQEPLLDVPRRAALNTHFGLLPNYKGMSPVLWAISEGEREVGVTIHRMVLAFDEGKIIRQARLPVTPGESLLAVTMRGCDVARSLLQEAVHEVAERPDAGRQQEPGGSYFSLPTRESIRELRRRGHALARLSDLKCLLTN